MSRQRINGHRHHVILTDPQHRGLERLAITTGLTTSELHRRAIDMFIVANKKEKKP